MAGEMFQGGCQCGAVRYRVTDAPMMAAICHCSMCRRAHSAPAVAWALFEQSQVVFSGQPLRQFSSSDEARRGFCADCGTQISFAASFLPGMIDISIGSLDDPDAITPQFHYWHVRRLAWAEFADALPRYPELPPFGDD